jgi:hypothetical protein
VDVRIKHRTKHRGFLFLTPYYEVWVTVSFEKWEKEIVYEANLYEFQVADRRPHPASGLTDREPLLVKDILDKTDGYAFGSFPAAKKYEADVLDGLQKIKDILKANIDPVLERTERI